MSTFGLPNQVHALLPAHAGRETVLRIIAWIDALDLNDLSSGSRRIVVDLERGDLDQLDRLRNLMGQKSLPGPYMMARSTVQGNSSKHFISGAVVG